MTIDGRFAGPPRPPIAARILVWATIVAAVAGGLSLAAFVLGLALVMLPVALGAAVIAWLAFRYQLWRARSQAFRRGRMHRAVWRP